jgi:hypothetical protein
MDSIDYIGFDIDKKTIGFCAKAQDQRIIDDVMARGAGGATVVRVCARASEKAKDTRTARYG